LANEVAALEEEKAVAVEEGTWTAEDEATHNEVVEEITAAIEEVAAEEQAAVVELNEATIAAAEVEREAAVEAGEWTQADEAQFVEAVAEVEE